MYSEVISTLGADRTELSRSATYEHETCYVEQMLTDAHIQFLEVFMARMSLYIREANGEALIALVRRHGFETVGCFLNDLVEKEAKGEAILAFLDDYEVKCWQNTLNVMKRPSAVALRNLLQGFCQKNGCEPPVPKKVQIEMTEEQLAKVRSILSLG